ncbi:MAG: TolC family protein [Sedimentisphaerales bacterium]|nr:TolC family protein [Sedimentisphaerales bacterium]
MKKCRNKELFNNYFSGISLVCRRIVKVFAVIIIVSGCSSWRTDNISDQTLKSGLDRIDAIKLADKSTLPPVTVEQATEKIIQEAAEPNQPLKTVSLSIEQVRAAALENNLNLKIELLSPAIAQQSLEQEKAVFDSTVYGSTNYQRSETVGTGAVSRSQSGEVGIEKPLPTGGELQVDLPFSDNYSSGGIAQASASVSYIQSLFKGAGTRVNTQYIRIAAHQWNITSARTKLAAINLLANADIAYWRFYAARKELEVRREQYKLAQDQFHQAKKKVAAGSAAKIEIVRAEAGLAGRLESVINAENAVQSYQRELLRIINRQDLPLEAPVEILTQTEPNPLGLELDEKRLVEQALANRMEMVELEQRLTVDELNLELARNSLLPDVTFSYTYSASAQDSGPVDAFGDLHGNSFDDHSIGISASIPLGNRSAKARLRQAKLEKLQDISSRDKYRQIIRLEVYEAVSGLESSWRRILAAEQGVTAAYRDYRVEQSQFQLGKSTSTNVLYSATGLADAQLRKIYAFADYEIAQINLARATGALLGQGQIQISPADIDASNP